MLEVLFGISPKWLSWVRSLLKKSRVDLIINLKEGAALGTITTDNPEVQAQIPELIRTLISTLLIKIINFLGVTVNIQETEERLRKD